MCLNFGFFMISDIEKINKIIRIRDARKNKPIENTTSSVSLIKIENVIESMIVGRNCFHLAF